MYGPREVLNRLKWQNHELETAQLEILHRGAPEDKKVIRGEEIRSLDSWYFIVLDEAGKETVIPYHRVQRIWRGTRLVWQRQSIGRPN